IICYFISSRRRHTRSKRDWSSDVCSSDLSYKSESDFWEKSAADYFSGLALGLFEDAKEREVNLNSINYMSAVGEERYATSNYIKDRKSTRLNSSHVSISYAVVCLSNKTPD